MMKRSPPSRPPNPPSDRARSTSGWEIPEPGDVLSYAYLWAREAATGQEEGLKDRPAVVVVAQLVRDGRTQLLVAPITHSKPEPASAGIEVPSSVKRHLGLDHDRSWIVTTELNRFIWPGPDVRIAAGTGTPLVGALPSSLFVKIRDAIVANAEARRLDSTKRTE